MVVKKLSDFTIESILDLPKQDKSDSRAYSKIENFAHKYYSFTGNRSYEQEQYFKRNDTDGQKIYSDIQLRKSYFESIPYRHSFGKIDEPSFGKIDEPCYRNEDFANHTSYKPEKLINRTFDSRLEFDQQCYRDEGFYPSPIPTFLESNKYASEYSTSSERIGHVRFSSNQSSKLQEVFQKHSYITPTERKLLASKLNLTEKQVKTWFQNKRAKQKRHSSHKSL